MRRTLIKPTPAQSERLALLAEEAAEVIQAVALGDETGARSEMLDFCTVATLATEDCGPFPDIAVEFDAGLKETLIARCAELVHIVSKIQRHGFESFHPNDPETTNRFLLKLEVARVLYLIRKTGFQADKAAMRTTWSKKMRFMHYQKPDLPIK